MSHAANDRIYYAAPFAVDGELLGVGAWRLSSLSPRWLEFCRKLLQSAGTAFDDSLPAPFERVGLKFTASRGAALATFSIESIPVASSAYLRGQEPAVEQQLLKMFVESARNVGVVRQCQKTLQPFAEVFKLSERPLHVVIAWGGARESDAGVIVELGNHFAAAYLCGLDTG